MEWWQLVLTILSIPAGVAVFLMLLAMLWGTGAEQLSIQRAKRQATREARRRNRRAGKARARRRQPGRWT